MLLINSEIEIDLKWTKNCVISQIYKTPEDPANPIANPPNPLIQATQTTEATFQINTAKRYVPVVTLSINDDIKFLENIEQGFKNRTISWNKYRFQITTQPKNNNSNYLIDPTFRNINRLFVLSFKNGNDDPTRNSFGEYCMPLVEIKDFNALIDNKRFFDQPVKSKQKHMKNLFKCQEITNNLLDFSYHQNYNKRIDIDVDKQTNRQIRVLPNKLILYQS